MILLYVRYERSYDAWVPNSENVYQVQSHFRDPDTGEVTDIQMSPYIAGTRLKQDYPQIQASVYALTAAPVVIRNGQALPTDDVFFVDNIFFDVLPIPLVGGTPHRLREPGACVSETEARKYFGDSIRSAGL